MQDQAVITLALRDVCLHAPKGRYVITYDGDGELDLGMDATPAAFQKGIRQSYVEYREVKMLIGTTKASFQAALMWILSPPAAASVGLTEPGGISNRIGQLCRAVRGRVVSQ